MLHLRRSIFACWCVNQNNKSPDKFRVAYAAPTLTQHLRSSLNLRLSLPQASPVIETLNIAPVIPISDPPANPKAAHLSDVDVDIRRFETSSPMPVQLLLLHDQWVEGGEEEEANSPGHDGEKQLL